ncbi:MULTISPECIES: putative nucleotide-diphospho-sugar transferase [Pseudoalteromonas]|uniref:Nucleotide-diphospho-sugar transferase n=1 Tax=Pseudoalteromonas luteoviolacea (strain 2ta16) TaxID=1353533 RepID=V4I5N0_PSEL2|nr:putative nucleotide-diphospho-sugar transferase [Pseudoalteromonas luteoviolacea]ESP95564.1 nucleotide-diphospho-sugar transferase [Pseudoalteromonas luteoviolacea 2ta16]KZN31047.1 hypothetical protein N483_04270 [Pseudoalteromonas luteoviolacea NCIMB 1944]MCG7548539.1 putative nucleotide-diphospho-sugar transferase [Pseudoalteromonas sp. Of7M-16]
MIQNKNETLVFSVALNGYQWRYSHCIKSQKQYAKKMGYDYVVITRPLFTSLGVECCWLKLLLLKAALQAGYKNVLFVDADAFIQDICPQIDSLFVADKFIYMAHGFSGEINSGVMLVRNTSAAIEWFEQVLGAIETPVAESKGIGWGENGHVAHFAKSSSGFQLICDKWNNTHSKDMNDYIRHFNYGPLKNSFFDKMVHKVIFKVSKLLLKCDLNDTQQQGKKLTVVNRKLPELFNRVRRIYPQFSK